MVTIAGHPVALNDRLYSRRAGVMGTVTNIGLSTFTLTITRDGGSRDYTVSEGGLVNGEREIYWHAPLELDLPKVQLHKRAKFQAVLDKLREVI